MNSKDNRSSGSTTRRNGCRNGLQPATAPHTTLLTALLTVLGTVLGTVAVTTPATAVSRGGIGGDGTVVPVCRPLGHVMVKSKNGATFNVRNDNFGGLPECLSVGDQGPDFIVSKSGVRHAHREPVAFPNIFTGCSWSVCTPESGLPARVTALRRPATSWRTSPHAAGKWNAAYDLWFARHNMTSGQADGAELMIWLSTRNLPLSSRRVVRIDHTRWYLAHWVARHTGATWNYIQFRRVRPVAGVTGLKLAPFIRAAERLRWIRPSWWLLNIEAGFEIWSGGRNLATSSFWARAR